MWESSSVKSGGTVRSRPLSGPVARQPPTIITATSSARIPRLSHAARGRSNGRSPGRRGYLQTTSYFSIDTFTEPSGAKTAW